MSDNPYQAPPEYAEAIGVKSGQREDLRRVAIYQKGLLLSILAYLLGYIVMFVMMTRPPSTAMAVYSMIVGIVILIGAVSGLVFVILLAIKVYHPVVGILLTLLILKQAYVDPITG